MGVAALAAAIVSVQAATTVSPVIVEANWARVPPKVDVARFILSRVKPAGRGGGSAKIRCEITVEGRAVNCVVLEEFPAGSGFGDALVAVVPHMHFVPKSIDGHPVGGGSLIIPMRIGGNR